MLTSKRLMTESSRISSGRHFSRRSKKFCKTQVVLILICSLLTKVSGVDVSTKSAYEPNAYKNKGCQKGSYDDEDANAVSFPGDEENVADEDDNCHTVGTTGQRVAGHLLAVLLLSSVAAAIVEVLRARISQRQMTSTTGENVNHDHSSSSSTHGSSGRVSRRTAFQEKSLSHDSCLSRTRSSSAGISGHQESHAAEAAATALATSRAQKALRARLLGGRPLALGGRPGGTPPLLRRSSFPVMTRTGSGSGRDSNSGSPCMGSRKPSVNDLMDEDVGDFQKRRVRIIRRF